jgi:hypothetical protein
MGLQILQGPKGWLLKAREVLPIFCLPSLYTLYDSTVRLISLIFHS